MEWKECKAYILCDYNRNRDNKLQHGNLVRYLIAIVRSESFKVTFWFRLLSFLRSKTWGKLTFYYPLRLYYQHISHVTGIQLPIGTKVGRGIHFFHFGTVVIANCAVIGKNASIHQGVTIGRIFAGPRSGVPTIGDNVVIFAGAKIVGNITVGDNAVIGPNAVVIEDIPDNSIAVGIPTRIVSNDSSRCFNKRWGEAFEHSYK